jgi:hypothetical protein
MFATIVINDTYTIINPKGPKPLECSQDSNLEIKESICLFLCICSK